MNDKLKIYLENRASQCKEKSALLASDMRRDEANMEKVRGNVYELFRTVIDAAEKTQNSNAEARGFFLSRLESIPASWQSALDKARLHGDDARAAIEIIKLEAAADIKAALVMWEVEA